MTTRTRVLADAVESLFEGSYAAPLVGLERELFAYRHEDPTAAVTIADMRPHLADVPDVAFEPGGQVELNPGPQPTAAAAVAVLRERERAARAALAGAGIHLAAAGLDPWRRPDRIGLQLTSSRYCDLDRYLSRRGSAGRRFMRQTAGLHVCVDLRPGAEGVVQWRAANLVAPVLAALFANSRYCEGRRLTTDGGRTAVCLATDPARMAYGRLGRTRDVVGEYARFAAAAPALSERFRDVDAHLSTLFPAVRPRGRYLELRCLDSMPGSDLPVAVALAWLLLGVRGVDDEVLAGLDGCDVPALWELAAGPGILHPTVRGIAVRLLRIASGAADVLPPGELPADACAGFADLLERTTRQRRSA